MAAPSLVRVVLASTSPYRRELLQRLKLPFETVAPHVDERPAPDELPESLALRLAQAKAAAVTAANGRFPANLQAGSQVKDKDLKAFGDLMQSHGYPYFGVGVRIGLLNWRTTCLSVFHMVGRRTQSPRRPT